MNTVLITGGAGFIGHHLVRSLSMNNKVLVLDNYSRGEKTRLNEISHNIEIKFCDIQRYEEIISVTEGYEISTVYHLAAINGTENFYKIPIEIMDVGILGCMNMLKFMVDREIKKGVFASSAEVYQESAIIPTPEMVPLVVPDVTNPRYSYGLSKIYTEYYAYQFGLANNLDISIFRPHNVYGPDMGLKHVVPELLMQLLKGSFSSEKIEIRPKGSLDAKRAFCYVDDVVEGLKILTKKNRGVNVYNVGNTDVIIMRELLDNLSVLSNIPYELVPTLDTHAGGTKLRCPDISKIKELGYNPKVSIVEGLSKTIDWYRRNYTQLSEQKSANY